MTVGVRDDGGVCGMTVVFFDYVLRFQIAVADQCKIKRIAMVLAKTKKIEIAITRPNSELNGR